MQRNEAREIALKITNEQLKQMFINAKNSIMDWTKVSSINKGMSKGVAWNILAKDFDINKKYQYLAKLNMVREFSEFLPVELKPVKKTKRPEVNIIHQNPDFSNW
jgi:hypothetical protein